MTTLKAIEIKDTINKSQNILLHCHPHPDPDSIGSVLAMKKHLESLGKDVTAIIGDSDYPTNMTENFPIEREFEKKNFFDLNLEEFDLFIILDSSSLNQVSQINKVLIPKHLKTIVIDHHNTNDKFGDINLVDENAVSTTQILYELFKKWDVNVDEELALYLFIGLYADSGGFKYPKTSPRTFQVATELTTIYPHYHKAVFDLENNKKEVEIEMMGLALSNIKKYFNDKVALSIIPYEIIREKNISKDDATEGLIPNILRSVSGWDIVASLVEVEKDITKVSLRTRDEGKYDVSKIAKSIGIDGGGHPGAAGTTIMKNIKDAEKELLGYITNLFG